jgi:hypothetical protein
MLIPNISETKDDPEVRRTRARRYVEWCNSAVHQAPWIHGDLSARGGIFIALELAEQAYQLHSLPYKKGLSNLTIFDPRRFSWLYEPEREGEGYVKVRDNRTGRVAAWPWF